MDGGEIIDKYYCIKTNSISTYINQDTCKQLKSNLPEMERKDISSAHPIKEQF